MTAKKLSPAEGGRPKVSRPVPAAGQTGGGQTATGQSATTQSAVGQKAPEPSPKQAPEPQAGEQPPEQQVTEVDAAVVLLNRMRQNAVARGEVRQTASRRRKDAARRSFANPAQFDAGRDPQGLGNVFNRMVKERGWTSPVAVGSVISRWDELVGADIGAHCRPESFQDTAVQVRCDSTAWATQLRLLSTSLLQRFEAELGPGVVTKIQVLGPAAPNWRKGYRTVKGRGPRDTYG